MHQFNIKSNIDTIFLELISIEGAVFKWVIFRIMTVKKPLKFIMFKAHIIDYFVKLTLLYRRARPHLQASKIALVRSYLRLPQAAGQVKILIFLVKIKCFPYMPRSFVMQGKCLF